MATVKQGMLVRAGEWWKHLRPFGKRAFWKRQRKAEQRMAQEAREYDPAARRTIPDDQLTAEHIRNLRPIDEGEP